MVESGPCINGVKIIKIDGVFNKDTTPKVCDSIRSGVKECDLKGVVLDFEGTTDIDSTAFACMIDVIRNNIKSSRYIGVLNMDDRARHMIKILKIGEIIRSFANQEEAIKFFNENTN